MNLENDHPTAPSGPDAAIAAKMYSTFLHSAKVFDHGSSLLALLMVLLAMRGGIADWALVAMLLLAALEKYHAFRVALDARLFALLAEPGVGDSVAFDTALASLSGKVATPRTLANRWLGARKLWTRQVACFVVQVVLLVGSVAGHLRW